MVAGDFRKGTTFEKDGKVFRVVDFQHVKPGKGSAFVRTKYKNVVTGQVLEESFSPTEKFLDARIDTKSYQFLYADDDFCYFMDPETFDQININIEDCRDALKYIIPEMMVSIQSYKDVPFSVDPPNFVELTIAETEPGIQGDTSKAGKYTVYYEVTDNGGVRVRKTIVVTVKEKSADQTSTTDSKKTNGTNTSANLGIGLFSSLAGASIVGAGLLSVLKKRNGK